MADPSPTRHDSPEKILLVQNGRFSRFLSFCGWSGFLICGFLLLSQSFAYRDYFDTTEGLQEKFHSGEETARDKVAIISIEGTILDGSGYVKHQIDRVRKDENVKSVVVRIVSPGGTISGSDYIYHHLDRLRKEKKIPLVVSMGGIAASGGYYAAMAVGEQEESIFAEPTTITGSIGVIIPHYDLSGLLARYDVKDDSIASHPRKQMLSMTRPMPEEHREILQAQVDDAFERFKEVVKAGRPTFQKDPAALNELATGEVFTAEKAKLFGLVDQIGFLEDAIERAMELAKLDEDETRVVQYERPASLFEIPGLVSSSGRTHDLATLFDIAAPRAYYLATTLPLLISSRR